MADDNDKSHGKGETIRVYDSLRNSIRFPIQCLIQKKVDSNQGGGVGGLTSRLTWGLINAYTI